MAEEGISLPVIAVAEAPRTGLHGHLRLLAGINAKRETVLREQSFCTPVHLGKSYLESGVLVAQVVNPTAGLLEGDRIDMDVRVQNAARLLLTNPSATRVHTMKQGSAVLEQSFSVEKGGMLEVLPDLFIPQQGARYEQKTEIHLRQGAELFFFEILTPGRVASGEVFAFDRLHWSTDIFVDGQLAARERYRLSPATASIHSLRAHFTHAYQVTCFAFSGHLADTSPCWQEIFDLQDDETLIGSSRLHLGGWVIKALVRDSLALRRAIKNIRATLCRATGHCSVAPRKN